MESFDYQTVRKSAFSLQKDSKEFLKLALTSSKKQPWEASHRWQKVTF
jgi:hypothetical protein